MHSKANGAATGLGLLLLPRLLRGVPCERRKKQRWVMNAPEAPCRAPSAPSFGVFAYKKKTQSEARKQRMRLVKLLLQLRHWSLPVQARQTGGRWAVREAFCWAGAAGGAVQAAV